MWHAFDIGWQQPQRTGWCVEYRLPLDFGGFNLITFHKLQELWLSQLVTY